MAGVMNNSARQYNLKSADPKLGRNTTVRLHPGFNVVKDEEWAVIKKLSYTRGLKRAGILDFGPVADKKVTGANKKTAASKSKSTPIAKKPPVTE